MKATSWVRFQLSPVLFGDVTLYMVIISLVVPNMKKDGHTP